MLIKVIIPLFFVNKTRHMKQIQTQSQKVTLPKAEDNRVHKYVCRSLEQI